MQKWFYLMLANFLGVFNDNFLKNAIIFIAVAWKLPAWLTLSQLISVVSASLVLPYLLLSPLGGWLTTHYNNIQLFRFFKLIEFPIMAIASLAFIMEWAMLAIFAVLLMGIQSCLYSPAKYGLIREVGAKEEIAFGSGLFETMAFLGILIGSVIASYLSDVSGVWIFIVVFFIVAIGGYVSTLKIKIKNEITLKSNEYTMSINPIKFLYEGYKTFSSMNKVQSAVIGVSSFWLIGALLQMNIIFHAKSYYLLTNTATGVVIAIVAIGIAIGTWLAGVFSSVVRPVNLMIAGLTSMIISLVVIISFKVSFNVFLVLMFVTTFSAGFYQVPNLTVIQKADSGERHGQLLAYMNLVIFIFVLLASVLFSLITFIFPENSVAVFVAIVAICTIIFSNIVRNIFLMR